MIITLTLNPALDRTMTIDTLRVGELNRINQVQVDGGGKGINVSKALAKLGIESRAMGFMAGDTGKQLVGGLSPLVTPGFTWLESGAIRVNTKILARSTGETTELNEAGPTVTARDCDRLLQDLDSVVDGHEYLVIAGSLPPGADNNFYAQVISWAHEREIKTILDASGDALIHGVRSVPWMIKPNVDEARQLGYQIKSIPDGLRAIEHWISQGIRLVVLTLGSQGALFGYEDQRVWAKGSAPNIGSTVGCGDSALAATVGYLSQGCDWNMVIRLAMATSTATATTEGTTFLSAAEIQPFLASVELQIL